ncbi:hypothetical protein KPH14_008895 [Odynerus spinipes]|uniref:Reverse transcriptase domain-containing protein n=1 Tax=Odynerus spinipes TaxID=1348599 RepID=A0AAD9RNA3_9HYME|nr:hypothetical protein KPH14_008895 [Odynerus spinipes]
MAAKNTNSIVTYQRRLDLEEFIKGNNLDIALLSETKLNKMHKIDIEGYDIIRTDRPNTKKGGGTAIIIQNNIPYSKVTYPSSENNSIIKYTIIKLKINRNQRLFLASIYATNKIETKQEFLNELNTIFTKLKLNDKDTYYILAGDYNARHIEFGDRTNNTRGRLLSKWERENIQQYKTKIYAPREPTYIPSNTILDIAIVDSRLQLKNLQDGKIDTLTYDSDHRAIVIEIQTELTHIPTTTAPRLLYKATKWNRFTGYLNDEYQIIIPDDRNLTKQEIDEHIDQISKHIQNAIDKKVPKADKKNKPNQYISNKIKKLHNHKSKLLTTLHAMQKTNYPASELTINYIKSLLKLTKEKIQEEIKANIEAHWTKIMNKIDYKNPDKFFPVINKVFRPRRRQEIPNIHVKKTDQNIISRSQCNLNLAIEEENEYIVTDKTDKLNIIGEYYEAVNSPRYLNTGTRFKEIIDSAINIFTTQYIADRNANKTTCNFSRENRAYKPATEMDTPKYFCSINEVCTIFKNLPNKTSVGVDKIPSIILKHLPMKIMKDYTVLFNNALNMQYFPDAWKIVKIIPILKKGKPPNRASSYRPISLTPNISKVYEAVINSRIVAQCETGKVIPDNQFGFRHQLSTVHAIHKLLSDVNAHLANNEMVGATLIDLEKAFDSVWINGLIYTLLNQPFRPSGGFAPWTP